MSNEYKETVFFSAATPNTKTLAAFDDVNHGRNLSKIFYNVSKLMKDLNT